MCHLTWSLAVVSGSKLECDCAHHRSHLLNLAYLPFMVYMLCVHSRLGCDADLLLTLVHAKVSKHAAPLV